MVDDYGSYASSFIHIKDERVEEEVLSSLGKGMIWPDPLIQLNRSFEAGETIDELVAEGILHEERCTPEGRGVSYRDDPENGGPR